MPEKPYISQGANTGDDLYAMGAFPLGIGTFNPTDIINPGDTGLFAGFEPVMEAISTPNPGGILLEAKTASGAAPLMISDAAKNQIWSLLTNIKPVQDLHGYANPWPAGGGANQWDEEWEAGRYNPTTGEPTSEPGIRTKNYIPVVAGNSYYLYCGSQVTNDFRILYYDENYTLLSATAWLNPNTVVSITSAAYIKFYVATAYGSVYKNDIALNYPSTVTTYSPYSNICPIFGWTGCNVYVSPTPNAADATVYPCVWLDEAGTVYGGQIDVDTGWMEVTHRYALLNDPAKWIQVSSTIDFEYEEEFSDRKKYSDSYTALLCSYMRVDTAYQNTVTARWAGAASNYFGLRWRPMPDLTQVLQDAQDGKIAICYELAMPKYYQIPATNIFTLEGQNYIWSDCGDQITVQYAAVK